MGGAIPLSSPIEGDCRAIRRRVLHSRKDRPSDSPCSRVARTAKAAWRQLSRYRYQGYLKCRASANADGERSKPKLARSARRSSGNGNKRFSLLPFIVSYLRLDPDVEASRASDKREEPELFKRQK